MLRNLLLFSAALLTLPVLSHATGTGRIFITNEGSDTISVINGKTLEVEQTVAVGKRPRGIGLSPDGKELYVAASEDNAIVVVDPASLKVLRSFPAGSDPETFAVHPNGHIYISNEDDAKASVFDPITGKQIAEIPVGLEPEGVAISPDGSRVIVTSESTNMLHVIRVPEHDIVANILVGARPRAAMFTRDGKLAYATSEISGEVKKVDMVQNKVIAVEKIADEKAKPKDVLLSVDEKTLYVAGGRADAVIVLDAATLKIKATIPVGKRVWGLARSRDGSRVYSTDGASNGVSAIDTSTNKVIKTITVGELPWGIAIDD
jgi:PQQ-dependent catabolism-associated beta-propeller protein